MSGDELNTLITSPPDPNGPIDLFRNPTSYARLVGKAYDATVTADLSTSRGIVLERSFDGIIDAVRNASGVQMENPLRGGYRAMAELEARAELGAGYGRTKDVNPAFLTNYQVQAFERGLDEYAASDPKVRDAIAGARIDFAPPMIARRAQDELEAARQDAPSLVGQLAAEIAGGAPAMMRDPINVAGLVLGGGQSAAATALGRILSTIGREALVNAGLTAAQQPFVQGNRRELGLEAGAVEAARNVALAGVFGGAFGGAFQGGREAFRRLPAGERGALGAAAASDLADGAAIAGSPPAMRGTEAGRRAVADAIEYAEDPLNRPPPELVLDLPAPRPDRARVTTEDGPPPVAPGYVRMYHGHQVPLDEFSGAVFVTPDPKYARNYRGGPNKVAYVDVPADHPALVRMVEPEDVASGIKQEYSNSKLPEEFTRQLRPFDQPTSGGRETVDGKPVTFGRFDPLDVGTDAAAFQYKGGGDAAGVTDRLRSVQQWDPVASGKAMIFEALDGSRTVADGHQRLGLARRLAAENPDGRVHLDGFMFREQDGWTRADVRAIAAKKNMQEGSGDALDAARVIRDRPDLVDGSLPTSAPMMRQALALARLSDEAWGMTVNGVVSPNHAAAVGATVADPLQHAAVLDLLAKSQPETERAARLLIGEALEAGFTAEHQIDLFGAADATRSLMAERVAVLDRALSELRKDRKLFGTLASSADEIEGAGNVLARDVNQDRAATAARLEDILTRVARRSGPVSDVLNGLAARLANGEGRTKLARAFLDEVQTIVETRGLIGLMMDPQLKPARIVEPGTPEALLAAGDAAPAPKRAESPNGRPDAPLARETALDVHYQDDIFATAAAASPDRAAEWGARELESVALHATWRELPAGPERDAIGREYLRRYGEALDAAGLGENSVGGTSSRPNTGSNIDRQTGSDITAPSAATDGASTLDQVPPGSSTANASADAIDNTAGRASQSTNTGTEPSLFEALPIGTRADGGDVRLVSRDVALAEADRTGLFGDLVASCKAV